MEVWHLRANAYARAFAIPKSFKQKIILYFRGWRPFGTGNNVWHKAGPNQKKVEQGYWIEPWRKKANKS